MVQVADLHFMGLSDTSWVLDTGSRGVCLFSLVAQSTGKTVSKQTHRHLWAVSDDEGWCGGDTVLERGVYLYSDHQRPLGRMRSKLPHKEGKGARHWKIKGRSREELFRKKEQLVGIP